MAHAHCEKTTLSHVIDRGDQVRARIWCHPPSCVCAAPLLVSNRRCPHMVGFQAQHRRTGTCTCARTVPAALTHLRPSTSRTAPRPQLTPLLLCAFLQWSPPEPPRRKATCPLKRPYVVHSKYCLLPAELRSCLPETPRLVHLLLLQFGLA